MTPQQIRLVQESFALVAADSDGAATTFYNYLFVLDPKLKRIFPVDLTEQRRKLMATLGFAVGSLDKLETLIPALENLGCKHAAYGVRDEHYETVGEALLLTLEQHLGEQFAPPTKSAWATMFGIVAETMQLAARRMALTV